LKSGKSTLSGTGHIHGEANFFSRGLSLQPRIIEVVFPVIDFGTTAHPVDNVHKYTSIILALLHVHRESRIEGLRYYQLSGQNDRNAMNQFYFNPTFDMLDVYSDWSQCRFFLRQNGSGLLQQVQKLTIAQRWLVNFWPALKAELPQACPALKEVVLVYRVLCLQQRGSDTQCCCKTKSLMDYAELTEEEKTLRELERNAERGVVGLSTLKSTYKSSLALICPIVRSVAICGNARRWKSLGRISATQFLDACATGES